MFDRLGVQVGPGETEHVSFFGSRVRKSTVLITVGKLSISRKALYLGVSLVACQILDGILTYSGLTLMGVQMEGNHFLRELMHAYGMAPILFAVKTGAILLAVGLMLHAHSRKWVRPVIFSLVLVYLTLAVIPWIYLISSPQSAEVSELPPPRSIDTVRIVVR